MYSTIQTPAPKANSHYHHNNKSSGPRAFHRPGLPEDSSFRRQVMANQADIRNLSFDKVTSVLCGSFSPIAFPFFIYIITLRLGLLEIITLRAFKIPFHQRKHQPRSLSCADGGKKVEPDTSGRHLTGVFRIKLSYLGNSISQNNSFCECFLVSRLCCIVTSKSFPVNAVELDGTPQTLSSHSLELEKEEGRTQPGPAACAP